MVGFAATVWTQCYLTNHVIPPFRIILLKFAQIFTIFAAIMLLQVINLHMLQKRLVSQILLCWTRLQWLAITYTKKRKMWHWFHLEHNIRRRDVCCYTLDRRKLQYYQYHVSFGSLLEYLSNSDMWYTMSPPCVVDLLLSSSFQGRGPELNFFFFFSLVKAFSSWAIIQSSGLHAT